MIVKDKSFSAAKDRLEKALHQRLATKLKTERTVDTGAWSEARLSNYVVEGCEDAAALEIVEESDIFRFLCIGLSPHSILGAPNVVDRLTRVLHNVDAPAHQRLDFIERCILKRRSG